MADGLFDDLIPQAKRPALGAAPAAAASGGLFDDLVPRANPFADVVGGIDTTEALGNVGAVTRVDPNEVIVPEGIAPEPPGLGESLYRRAQAGLSGLLGGTSRFLGETLAPVRPQSPLVAAAIDQVLPTRAGTALTDTGVSLGELSAATRAEAQSGERPASIMDALTNPGDTARYYGGIGAESLPAILVALATRNPGAATAVAGGTTAAQSYGDLRQQGVAIPQAIRGATEQGVLEAAGSQAPLERAFGGAPLGRRILQTTGDEVAGEVATQLGQDVAERTGRGEDVPVGELLLGALDAAIASAPGGVVEALGGRGPEPGAVPRETTTYRGIPVVADQTLGGEPIARPEPPRQAAPRTPAAEALDDLDALLEQLPRPEAAAPESPTASPSEPPTGAPPREAAATLPETIRTDGAPPDRARIAPAADPLDLRREIGWSEIGGRMIREADTGGLKPEVVGRTQWVGQMAPDGSESSFWRNRPDRALTERQANEAFDKFERGEPLRPIEQRFIDHARSTAEGYARAEQEIAEDLLAYDQAEQARAVQNLREAHDIDVSEADGADALSLYELVRRNAERGVPLEELDQPQAESDRAYAARLWNMLRESTDVDANATRSDQGGGEARRAEPPVRAAAPSGAGLFAAPTAREVVDAEARRRDAERDGRTGTGRTDMAAGAGELFAGPRPEQVGLEDVSVRERLAERRAEREAERATRLPRVQDTDQRARTVVQESDGWHVQFDDKTVSPGATQDDAIAARDEHNDNRRRAASSDLGAELVADVAEESRRGGDEDAEQRGLRAEVNRVLGPIGERVEYVRGQGSLPAYLRSGIESRQAIRDQNLRTAAVYDPRTRRVYLFTDVVTDPKRAAFHAAHEIAGHDGLRALLGDKLDPALGIARQNPTVRAVADAIAGERNLDLKSQSGLLLSTEEALAELAAAVRTGNYDEIQSRYKVEVPEGVRGRLKEAIANFLKRLRAAIDDLFGNHQFTDEDVRALLENAWQAANDGTTIDADAAPLESTAPDQTQTPAFKRWFGDSKVVDKNGQPLVVYRGEHGADTEQEVRSALGSFTFTDDPEVASTYAMDPNDTRMTAAAPRVVPAYLRIENPITNNTDDPFLELGDIERALGRDEAVRIARKFADRIEYTGNWMEDLANEFDSVDEMMDAAPERVSDLYFDTFRYLDDPEEVAKLKAAGYDGAIHLGNGISSDATEYRVFDRSQIKSATGNRGTFDPDSASILESTARMTPAAAEAAAEVRRNDLSQTLPAGRGTIGWNYDDSAWTGTQGQLSNARARLQDKMIAWRDVQDQIASQVGQAIPDTANVYRLENLMHGRVATGIERIEDGQVEPLMKAMREAGVSQERLEEYLYARHAKERNADIARKNPSMPDGGSGMTNAEADQILRAPDVATLEPLAKRVDAIVRSTRRRMLDAGLITQEQFDAMEAQYTAYVPLRGKRVAETDFQPSEGGAGRGIDTRRNPIREALGRGAGNRADNILAEVIGDAQRSVILAEKARVGRAVLRLVLANPNPTLWQVEPVQTERTTDASGEVYERVVHDWSDPSIIAVKHRGQTYKVQINNVPLAQALSNVGIDQMGAVTRAAGAINRYFSAVLTQYNPAFLPVNATRDAIFGMTAMAAEHGERAALDAALHYPQAATAAFRHSIGKSGSGAWDRWATEFADAGGRTGYVSMPSVEDMSRKIGKGALSNYSPEGLKRAAFAVGDAISSMNDAVENALRLSAYVTLRKRGSSIEEAAAYAKDLTVNFNRKGYDGSRLNAWFLFYNAGIQGAKRASDVMRKPKTWGYLGALAAAQTVAAMYAMGLEDDDGENLWNKVPDHVKRRNLVIVLPDEGVVTIPMPYGFNVFTYMAGRVPAAMTDPDPKRSNRAATVASDMLSTATESFFPVPVGEGALGLLPTVLRIPVNIQTNRDDFGREIRRESMAKYDVPRASMGKPDTLEVFKLGAQAMNRVGGGDKYTPPDLSWFDVAPEDMEYLLGELGGGAGKFVIDTATVGQNLTGGDYSPGVKPKEIPIAGRFYQTIDQEASTAAQFYERRDAINRSLERVRDLYAEKGAEAAEAMLKAAPELKGAAFKRRKRDSDSGEAGSVIESNGRPQIIVAEPKSVFGLYKAAEEAIGERNEGVRQSYTSTPAQIIPTAETRIRDANVRTQNTMRAKAQRDFNTAWSRDVTGSIE
jgi:hypothetical protein